MEQIIIQVHDQSKAQLLLELLRAIDFVNVVEQKETASITESDNEEAFFALAGLWEGRDVTQDSLREKAWPMLK